MKFISQLFGKKSSSGKNDTDVKPPVVIQPAPCMEDAEAVIEVADISGDQVGKQIASLLPACEAEGWVPAASLKIVCNQCDHPIGLEYNHPVQGGGVGFRRQNGFKNLDDSIRCEKCKSNKFRIENRKLTFRNWLCLNLEALAPCADDPEAGFLGSESGQIITDHNFQCADTFQQLWEDTASHFNQDGTLNDNFTFNYLDIPGVGTRRINRTIGVAQQNGMTRELIVMIKDRKGRFWYRIQQGQLIRGAQ